MKIINSKFLKKSIILVSSIALYTYGNDYLRPFPNHKKYFDSLSQKQKRNIVIIGSGLPTLTTAYFLC